MFKSACGFSVGDKMVSRGISDKVEVLIVTHSAYPSLKDAGKVWIEFAVEFGHERRLFDSDAQLEFEA